MELESETERARNESEQHRLRAADMPLQYHKQSATIPYSTVDSTHVKNLKMNSAEVILDSSRKPLLQSRTVRAWGRTVRKYGHRATKKVQKKSWLPDCPLQYSRLSANRESARTESSENRLLSSIFRFEVKTSPTATKLGEYDHKVVGELPLRNHRPIWSQTTENRRGTKKHRFLQPRPRNRPIY
jgi:hypothetical protein